MTVIDDSQSDSCLSDDLFNALLRPVVLEFIVYCSAIFKELAILRFRAFFAICNGNVVECFYGIKTNAVQQAAILAVDVAATGAY